MHVRVFTLRFDPAIEAFDDAPVREFLADKAICDVRDHFFVREGVPYLTLVLTYHPGAAPAPTPAAEPGAGVRRRDESWRELLSKADWPLFNTLREWRAERAKADGVPPYVIANNRQLAEVVKDCPQTLSALGVIEGFGDAKLRRYGKELLALVAGAAVGQPVQPDEGGDG